MDELPFGVRELGLAAARLAGQALDYARENFAKAPPKSVERPYLAICIQHELKLRDGAVRINRSRFKLIKGDKS
jgi:hypothetical protein